MSTRIRGRLGSDGTDDGDRSRARTLAVAAVLTALGTVVSLPVFFTYRPFVTGLLSGVPQLATLAGAKGVQVAFGAFTVAYVVIAGRPEGLRLRPDDRRSWLREFAWVVVGTAGLELAAAATRAGVQLAGASLAPLSGTGTLPALANWSVFAPVVFAGTFLLPALLEESFFRGIVYGRLREAFGPGSAALSGGVLFTLAHGLYGIGGGVEFLSLYLAFLLPQGVVFCAVYERTETLLPVGAVHALSWTELTLLWFL